MGPGSSGKTVAGTGLGPVALVGSGEYLPGMDDVDRLLLQGRAPRTVQLATAAAPEGVRRLEYWQRLGAESAARLGVEQVVLPVVDRSTADDPALASLVDGAGLVYLSGGNPVFLARTLAGTAVEKAIVAAWRGGAALAGCSAGAMALSATVVDFRHPLRHPVAGLAIVPYVRVIPHFDRFVARLPRVLLRRLQTARAGETLIGIDEDTALVGDGGTWRVHGRQSVWVLTARGRTEFRSGQVVALPAVDA